MHMVAAKLGSKEVMIGTKWANFYPGCMNGLTKCCSHLVRGLFLAERVMQVSSMIMDEVDYEKKEIQ